MKRVFEYCLISSAYSALFGTCSKEDIRVWNANTSKELLRITVPNITCHAIEFMRDGKSIISGKYTIHSIASGWLTFEVWAKQLFPRSFGRDVKPRVPYLCFKQGSRPFTW